MDRQNSARDYYRHKRHDHDQQRHTHPRKLGDRTPKWDQSYCDPDPGHGGGGRYGTGQSQDFVWKWLEETGRQHEGFGLPPRHDGTDDRILRDHPPRLDDFHSYLLLASTNQSGKRHRSPHADIIGDHLLYCRHGSADAEPRIASRDRDSPLQTRPASRLDFVDSDQEGYSPPLRFEKRSRHKTCQDKYERRRKPLGTRKHSESTKPGSPKRRKDMSKKQLASRREVMNNFTSGTIRRDRVTVKSASIENNSTTQLTPDQLQPGATPGIFQNGLIANKKHGEYGWHPPAAVTDRFQLRISPTSEWTGSPCLTTTGTWSDDRPSPVTTGKRREEKGSWRT